MPFGNKEKINQYARAYYEANKIKLKEKREANKCEHNRRRTDCKECGGSAFCEHNKIKQHCIECEGSSICEHKKRKFIYLRSVCN